MYCITQKKRCKHQIGLKLRVNLGVEFPRITVSKASQLTRLGNKTPLRGPGKNTLQVVACLAATKLSSIG